MTSAFPTGTVTFLFTDLPDRAALWARFPQAISDVLDRYAATLAAATRTQGGVLFERREPLLGAAFASPMRAVTAALAARRALDNEWWGELDPLEGRVALHTGVVTERDGDYVGRPVQRVKRLLAVAHEGQILLSQVTQELVRDQLPAGTALRDLGTYYLGEGSQPERLFQLVGEDLPTDFPPLRSPARRPNNLPTPPTPLIGRGHEIAAVMTILGHAEVRLLTLTGPGGVGKTRLGLQAAARLQMDFVDGVFLVDFGSLRDPDLVVPTIAHTLGLTEAHGRSLLAHLSDHLAAKQLLLVLDSFEHVLPAAPALGALLAAAPRLKLLVTSRAVLHLAGEHEFPVAPLALPEHRPGLTTADATSYAAVALFIQRAQAVKPDFAVTDETIPAIVQICQRLDGLPLALELAAARSKLFSPPVLLQYLARRLPLLTGGARDLPARQQTLRNTLDWSYHLLDHSEQRLLQQLAIFEGGFTLNAAETVCRTDCEEPGAVLTGLTSLVDQSLLRQVGQGGGPPRFTMLDTIKEYALEQLERGGGAPTLRQRHAAYFLRLAERAETELWGLDMRRWLDRLDIEYANLRAALSRTRSQGEAVLAARLASALGVFWEVRHRREGHAWLEAVLASESALPPTIRAKTLHAAGVLARTIYDRDEAKARLEESLALYRTLGHERGLTVTLTDLGAMMAMLGGDQQRAKALLEEGVERYRALGNEPGMSWALYGLGWVELRRVLGERHGSAWPLAELDSVERQRGQLNGARALFAESLSLRRAVGEPYHIAWALASLALVAATQHDYDVARALTEERLAIERALGNAYGIAASLQQLGVIVFRRGDAAASVLLLLEGVALARERNDKYVIALSLLGLGEVMHSQGERARAKTLLEEALTHFRELDDPPRVARVIAWLAQIALDEADDGTARALATQSLALARSVGAPEPITACLAGLGDSAARQDRAEWAARLWGAAEYHHESAPSSRTPVEPATRASLRQATRASLGREAFAAAWTVGRTLSPEEVVASLTLSSSPPAPGGKRVAAAPAAPSPRPVGLTPRQLEVLLLVAEGLSNAQIAERLVISVATVKAHLTAVYRKLGVSSRTAAVRYVTDHLLS